MKKKYLIIISIIVLLIGLVIVYFLNRKEKDGVRFQNEYSYLEIDSNNPFIYKSAKDIEDLINEKNSFLVFFGYPNNDDVNTFLPKLIEFLKNNNVDLIYYVNIEKIRNEVIYNGKSIETVKIGTQGYYHLLDILDELLDDFYVLNSKGKKISAGKRIEAPTLLVVKNGKPVKIIRNSDELEEIVDLIKPSYMCEDTAC